MSDGAFAIVCGCIGAGSALGFWVGFLVGIHYQNRRGIDFDWTDSHRGEAARRLDP